MSTTSEEIPQLLQNLRLYKMAATVESELAAARKSSPSYSDFLARLLRAEWLDQQQRKLQARIQRRLPRDLDSGVVPLQTTTWGFAPSDPGTGGTGVHPQGHQYRLYRSRRCGQDRTGLGAI